MYIIHSDNSLPYFCLPAKPLPAPFFSTNLFPTFMTVLYNIPQTLTWVLCGTMVGSLVSPQLVTVSCPLFQNLFIARTFSQNIINSSVANGRPHGPQFYPSWLLGGLSFRGHSADTEFTIAWPPGAQNMSFIASLFWVLNPFCSIFWNNPPSLKSVVWMSC